MAAWEDVVGSAHSSREKTIVLMRMKRLFAREVLKYCVPYRNRTRSGGQSIAGHESDVVGSNSYDIM